MEEFAFSGKGERYQLWLCSWSKSEPICILKHFSGEHPSANCKSISFSAFIFRTVLFGAIPVLCQEPSHSLPYCLCKCAVQVEVPQLPVQLPTGSVQGSSSGWRPREITQHSKCRNKSSGGAEHCFYRKKPFSPSCWSLVLWPNWPQSHNWSWNKNLVSLGFLSLKLSHRFDPFITMYKHPCP